MINAHIIIFFLFTFMKIKNASTNFVQKEDAKVISTTANKNDKTSALLPTEKDNTELQHITKIVEQNAALPSLARKEKTNEARNPSLTSEHSNSSIAVNNDEANELKPPPSAVCSTGKKKNSFVNGHKCNGLANSNDLTVVEDDDLIPPTPSPAGQHSFINCRPQRSGSSASKIADVKVNNHLSATDYYNSEQRKKEEVKMDCAVTGNNKESFVSDSLLPSNNSLETRSTTCTTSRKKYKLSRKGKLPKVLSSPLKGRTVHVSKGQSPKKQKHAAKGTEVADQKESTPVIAPSKCVVLRSRMKRSATKGSSPLQKRLQTELPLPDKVLDMYMYV